MKRFLTPRLSASILLSAIALPLFAWQISNSIHLHTLGSAYVQDSYRDSFPHLSSYLYCASDPINNIDPTGNYTYVVSIGRDKFEVVDGKLDDDLNIYEVRRVNDNWGKIRVIGKTTSNTSFFSTEQNIDKNTDLSSIEESGKWIGSIDLNDRSGEKFLNDFYKDPPTLVSYIEKGRSNQCYDFKARGSENINQNDINDYYYRGMPIGVNSKGVLVITSARDIGNMAAGYVAAINGLSWRLTRAAFDIYQILGSSKFKKEGLSSTNAQLKGWKKGFKETSRLKKLTNLIKSTFRSRHDVFQWITR